MRSLRNKAVGIVLLVLCLAQLSALAFVIWQDRSATKVRIGEHVEATAKMLGQLYATRRTQTSQMAFRLANDIELRPVITNGSAADIARQVQLKAPQEKGGFVAILNDQFEILALINGPDIELDLNELEGFLKSSTLSDGSVVANVGQDIFTVSLRSFGSGNDAGRILAGFSPQSVLADRIQGVSASKINLSVLDKASDQQATSSNDRIVLPLDQSDLGALNVAMDFSESQIYEQHNNLIKKLAAQALATFGVALLLSVLLFTRFIKKRVNEPIRIIRRKLSKIKKGEITESVSLKLEEPYRSIEREIENMQVAIADRENRIMHHAEYDALTGLTNRSVIDEKLKMSLSRAERSGSVISALAIDLSRFSEINGSLGHEIGDAVLKEIARRLASNARITDTVARVGGDEFFVILEDTDINLAQQLAKFMVSSLMTPIHVNGSEIKLSIHAGVAFYPQHCDNAEALRRMANIALYTGKENNDTLVIYEPGQDEQHLRELAIIHDLPSAIKNNELYLQYQPKIDMETQQVKQVEALVRWRHPQLGFIPPDEFIALLEKAGLINRLTDWVFKEAIRQSQIWKDEGFDLGVAVNISANDLSDERLPERIKLLLRHYLVDASKVTIEVTESAVIKDPENSVKVLNTFRKTGIRVSLDDFGTGQTSLALLKQLPISEIKIDKSFVQNLRADSGDAIIVKSIIDLGHNMGLHVTAEGVESNYCWNLLNSYGCNLVQGYLVSAPLTADELGEWHLRLQDRHMNKLDLSFVHDMTA